MLALLAAVAIAAQADVAERVKRGVEELRAAASIEEREAAMERLAELGAGASGALKEAAARERDATMRAQLADVEARIARAELRGRVYRPARPVTLDVKDRPLAEAVREACAQAGVECVVEAEAGARRVSLKAEGQPLLRVLDGLCGDAAAWQVRDGRIRVSAGGAAAFPTAYDGGFRLQIRRVTAYEVSEGGRTQCSMVMYFGLEAEPGITYRDARFRSVRVTSARGEASFRPLAEALAPGVAMAPGMMLFADGVPVTIDKESPTDLIFVAREVPGGLREGATVAVEASFRFAAAKRTVSCKAKPRDTFTFEGTAVQVQFWGGHLAIDTTDGSPLEAVADLDSLVAVGSGGEEVKSRRAGAQGPRVMLVAEAQGRRMGAAGEVELRMAVYSELFEKTARFELKDVRVRR